MATVVAAAVVERRPSLSVHVQLRLLLLPVLPQDVPLVRVLDDVGRGLLEERGGVSGVRKSSATAGPERLRASALSATRHRQRPATTSCPSRSSPSHLRLRHQILHPELELPGAPHGLNDPRRVAVPLEEKGLVPAGGGVHE